jgi:hypothetical protein
MTDSQRPSQDVAEIFRKYLDDYKREHKLSYEQSQAAWDIMNCRTPTLGGVLKICNNNECKHWEFADHFGRRIRRAPTCLSCFLLWDTDLQYCKKVQNGDEDPQQENILESERIPDCSAYQRDRDRENMIDRHSGG